MCKRHIAVPERTLKKFSPNGTLHFLDLRNKTNLENNILSKETTASFMAEPNYYPPDVEKIFSDKIESIMGRLEKGFLDDIKNGEIPFSKYHYWKDLHDFAKEIIAVQSLRNPDYMRKYFLIHFKDLPYRGRKGAQDFVNKFLIMPNKYNEYLKIFYLHFGFDKYRSMILINKTARDFFLPTTHYYRAQLSQDGGSVCYVIIISPEMSWVLITNDDYKRDFEEKGGESVLRITDIETIKFMNYCAFKFENKYGSKKIVSTENELKNFDFKEYNSVCDSLDI